MYGFGTVEDYLKSKPFQANNFQKFSNVLDSFLTVKKTGQMKQRAFKRLNQERNSKKLNYRARSLPLKNTLDKKANRFNIRRLLFRNKKINILNPFS